MTTALKSFAAGLFLLFALSASQRDYKFAAFFLAGVFSCAWLAFWWERQRKINDALFQENLRSFNGRKSY